MRYNMSLNQFHFILCLDYLTTTQIRYLKDGSLQVNDCLKPSDLKAYYNL